MSRMRTRTATRAGGPARCTRTAGTAWSSRRTSIASSASFTRGSRGSAASQGSSGFPCRRCMQPLPGSPGWAPIRLHPAFARHRVTTLDSFRQFVWRPRYGYGIGYARVACARWCCRNGLCLLLRRLTRRWPDRPISREAKKAIQGLLVPGFELECICRISAMALHRMSMRCLNISTACGLCKSGSGSVPDVRCVCLTMPD